MSIAIPTAPPLPPSRAERQAGAIADQLRKRALEYLHREHANGATVVRIEHLNEILLGPSLAPYTVRNRQDDAR